MDYNVGAYVNLVLLHICCRWLIW